MKLVAKFLGIFLGLAVTIISSIVGGLEWADLRMDKKTEKAKTEIRNEMLFFRKERDLKIHNLDVKLITEIAGIKTQVSETNKNVRVLIGRSNRELVMHKKIELFNQKI